MLDLRIARSAIAMRMQGASRIHFAFLHHKPVTSLVVLPISLIEKPHQVLLIVLVTRTRSYAKVVRLNCKVTLLPLSCHSHSLSGWHPNSKVRPRNQRLEQRPGNNAHLEPVLFLCKPHNHVSALAGGLDVNGGQNEESR